ncbi:MAG: GAF domain-containing protein, partial [Isosphaeraceae bacterium]
MDLLEGDEVSPLRCVERTCNPHRDLRALHTTADVLAAGSGQEETLLKILQMLETELGMIRGTVMLVSPDGSELQLAAATGVDEDKRGKVSYRVGEGVTGEVLRTGTSIIVPRISAEPRFQDRVHSRDQSEKTRLSFICVPVVVGSQVVGSLAVDLACRDLAELEDQELLLAIVAGMIAHDVKARRMAHLQHEALESENLKLRDALEENIRPANMVGNST